MYLTSIFLIIHSSIHGHSVVFSIANRKHLNKYIISAYPTVYKVRLSSVVFGTESFNKYRIEHAYVAVPYMKYR